MIAKGMLLILFAAPTWPESDPITEQRRLDFGATTQVILAGKVTRDVFEKKCLSILEPTRIAFGRVLLLPDRLYRSLRYREGRTSCIPDNPWRSGSDRDGVSPCPPIYEAIKVGQNIIMRTVAADCTSETTLLRGSQSALLLPVAGPAQIADLSIRVAPRSKETWGREYAYLTLFVRSEELAIPAAKGLVRWAKGLSGARDLEIELRRDNQFGYSCDFLLPFLFDKRPGEDASGRPPRRASPVPADHVDQVTCISLYPHPVQCWTTTDKEN